ncbi:MAG: hypothetical protein LBU09_05730, partial [Endomicrobium sp.]|nr:hypothetical protein [Endomicrobium sp.]
MNQVLSWSLAFMLLLNAYPSFAQEKRDVKDPVLREIISQMKGKMPKFINKHGDTLFVEDEPVSRASLLSAFYEYDISASAALKSPSYASLQDLENLSKKVDALSKSSAKSEAGSSAPAKADIVALIKELDPNMPMLLDKNLKDSKVFKDLQKQIASPSKPLSSMSGGEKDLQDVNEKIEALSKRLDAVKSASPASGGDGSYVDREISAVNKRIEALSKKLEAVKSAPGASSGLSSASSGVSAAYVDAEIADLNRKIEALS